MPILRAVARAADALPGVVVFEDLALSELLVAMPEGVDGLWGLLFLLELELEPDGLPDPRRALPGAVLVEDMLSLLCHLMNGGATWG